MKLFSPGMDFNNLSGGSQSLNSGNAKTVVNDGAYHTIAGPALFFFNTNDWFFIRVGLQLLKGATSGGTYVRFRAAPTGAGIIRPSLPNPLDTLGALFYCGESNHVAGLPFVYTGGVLLNVGQGDSFTCRWEALSLGSDSTLGINDLVSDLQMFPA